MPSFQRGRRAVRLRHYFLLSFLLAALPGGALLGEVLYLHNGEILIGDIVGQTGTAIRIQTDQGVRTIPKAAIARTAFQPGEEARARAILKQREDEKKRREEEDRERAEQKRRVEEAAARSKEQAREGPGAVVARSAYLPGFGHVAMEKPATGYTYMALTALALGNALYAREGALAAQARYNQNVLLYNLLGAAGEEDLETRLAFGVFTGSIEFRTYQDAVNRYNTSLLVLGGVYALQLFHAAFDAHAGGTAGAIRAGETELRFAALPPVGGRDDRMAVFAEFRMRF